MKPISAFVLPALIILMSTAPGCNKDTGYMGTIKITGPNNTVPSCAPTFNAIWQNTMAADSFTTLSNTPASIGINNTTVYPVLMNIDWVAHTPTCQGEITIINYQLL